MGNVSIQNILGDTETNNIGWTMFILFNLTFIEKK